jgi:hypothetical protein
MRFRLPKPLHGWRELAWEVGIIVIGVLIALGAQQIAEGIHDSTVAAATRKDIAGELNSNLMSLKLRERAESCIEKRLSELRVILAQWDETGSFKAPLWVAQTPVIEVELSRYEAALAAGRLALLSGEEQYRMGAVVARIRRFNEVQLDERLVWGKLRALQVGPKRLSVDDRTLIRAALQDASSLDYTVKVSNRQALQMARRYGFEPDAKGFQSMAPQVWAGGNFTPSICTAIDTPPDQANKSLVTPLPL